MGIYLEFEFVERFKEGEFVTESTTSDEHDHLHAGRSRRDTRTSATLLRRLVERDGSAWKLAHEYYGGLIFRWCRRNRCSVEVAEEIAQETLTRALQKLDDFEPREHPGGFRGWLRKIALRLLIEDYRQTVPVIGTRDSSFHFKGAPVIEAERDDDEFVDSVMELIRSRTSVNHETAMHFIEYSLYGRSAKEIAARSSLPVMADTVYRHAVLVAKALRNSLGDTDAGDILS